MNIPQKLKLREILLIEDNPGHIILTKRAFKKALIESNITVARNGSEALQILRHKNSYANAPDPEIILLDLNLPQKTGDEVLIKIKSDPHLKFIPVIILSSSDTQNDILNCCKNHANAYVKKPKTIKKYDEIVDAIEKFWLSIAMLPIRKKME